MKAERKSLKIKLAVCIGIGVVLLFALINSRSNVIKTEQDTSRFVPMDVIDGSLNSNEMRASVNSEEIGSSSLNYAIVSTSTVSNPIIGDVDGDGLLTPVDAQLISEMIVKRIEKDSIVTIGSRTLKITDAVMKRMDTDGNGVITSGDAQKVHQEFATTNQGLNAFSENSHTFELVQYETNPDEVEFSKVTATSSSSNNTTVATTKIDSGNIIVNFQDGYDVSGDFTLTIGSSNGTASIKLRKDYYVIVSTTPVSNPIAGDVDGDGLLTYIDSMLIEANTLKKIKEGDTITIGSRTLEITDAVIKRMDANGNGAITLEDATTIGNKIKSNQLMNINQKDEYSYELVRREAYNKYTKVTATKSISNAENIATVSITTNGDIAVKLSTESTRGGNFEININGVANIKLEKGEVYLVSTTTVSDPIVGDVDGDGLLTNLDALLILKYDVGQIKENSEVQIGSKTLTITEEIIKNIMDFDRSGEVTAGDANGILLEVYKNNQLFYGSLMIVMETSENKFEQVDIINCENSNTSAADVNVIDNVINITGKTEGDYEISVNGGAATAKLAVPVARTIVGEYFESIDAVYDCVNGDINSNLEVELLRNVETGITGTIKAKSFTLDLNGYTYKYTGSEYAISVEGFDNDAGFYLCDTKGTGNLVANDGTAIYTVSVNNNTNSHTAEAEINANIEAKYGAESNINGKILVSGGKITSTSTGIFAGDYGNIEIRRGKIESTSSSAIVVGSVYTSANTVNITGGTIIGKKHGLELYAVGDYGCKLVNGIIRGEDSGVYIYEKSTSKDPVFIFSGGEIQGKTKAISGTDPIYEDGYEGRSGTKLINGATYKTLTPAIVIPTPTVGEVQWSQTDEGTFNYAWIEAEGKAGYTLQWAPYNINTNAIDGEWKNASSEGNGTVITTNNGISGADDSGYVLGESVAFRYKITEDNYGDYVVKRFTENTAPVITEAVQIGLTSVTAIIKVRATDSESGIGEMYMGEIIGDTTYTCNYTMKKDEKGNYYEVIVNGLKAGTYDSPDLIVKDACGNSTSIGLGVVDVGRYKVTFDANGGNVDNGKEYMYCFYGDKYEELPTPTKAGYKFVGWFTEKNGGTEVTKDTSVPEGDHTLYAKWEVRALNSIEVATMPTKTVYRLNSQLDLTGGKLKLIYNNGETDTIDMSKEGVSVSGFNSSTEGKKTLTITYGGKSTSFKVTVTQRELSAITIEKSPDKTQYFEGENFDKTGMVVKAEYKNPYTDKVDVTDSITITNGDNLKIGTTSVEISYTENEITKTVTQTITVEAGSYTVSYDGNGSTSGSMETSTFTRHENVTLSENTYKQEYTVTYNYNYEGSTNKDVTVSSTFLGWADTSDATEKVYDDKANVRDLAEQGANKTLYAVWQKGTIILETPTRDGYTFKGWAATEDATEGTMPDEEEHPVKANSVLYAVWQKIEDKEEKIQTYIDVTGKVEPGETITATVGVITGNKKVKAISGKIEYDSDSLEFIKYSVVKENWKLTSFDETTGEFVVEVEDAYKDNEDMFATGTEEIFKLDFKVKDDFNDKSLKISLGSVSATDSENNKVLGTDTVKTITVKQDDPVDPGQNTNTNVNTNSNTNNTNSNTNTNNNTNNISNTNTNKNTNTNTSASTNTNGQKNDQTTANKVLPKAGQSLIVIIIGIAVIASGTIIFVKYKNS